MNGYRTEIVNGRHLLCGGVLSTDVVKIGQVWAPADGTNRAVKVTSIEEG